MFKTFISSIYEQTDHSLHRQSDTKLLNEVRKAKSLYCSDDPDHNNVVKNRLKWLVIAEKCKKTVSEVVSKWHTLLRIYFSSSPDISWLYNTDFQNFEPYLSNHRLQSPTNDQRNLLLKELSAHSTQLLVSDTTPKERENIWFKIIFKCNAITPGVIMSNLNWQKYWYFLKQNFGDRLYTLQSRFDKTHSNVTVKYTEEELLMIQICQASRTDTFAKIIKALGENHELGTSREIVVRICKKCFVPRDEILIQGCCTKCCDKPIFCNLCDVGGALVKYNVSHWTKQALALLPIDLTSNTQISVCFKCADNLKRKATYKWKICRICEAYRPNLESLYYCKFNADLRRGFKEATKYELNEKDGLPGYICKECKVQIININEFILKFKRIQNRLMNVQLINFIGNFEGNPYDLLDADKSQGNSDEMMILPDQNTQSDINNPVVPEAKTKASSNAIYKCPINIEVVPIEITPARKLEPTKKADIPVPTHERNPGIDPELAVKNAFSLQRKRIQSKISIVPIATLQSGKLDSNRISNAPSAFGDNIPAVTKRVGMFPSVVIPEKPHELIPFMQKSLPHITMKLKKNTASKPAIFTIPKDSPPEFFKRPILSKLPELAKAPVVYTAPDFETVEDAPPVFCIPKYPIQRENSTSDAEKQLMAFNPRPSKVIKIENIDDDYDDYGGKEIATTTNIPQQNPNESSRPQPDENRRKVIIKSDIVDAKPKPYILGTFVPIDYNGGLQTSRADSKNRLKPPIISNINPDKKSKEQILARPINIKKISCAKIGITPNNLEQQVIKKPRKYWGTVDEFQVAPLISKDQPIESISIQSSSEVQIKDEIMYNDETSDAVASYNNQNSSFFYCNTTNKISSQSIQRVSSIKLRKLRINIKRSKRIRMMFSKSKKLFIMQSMKESEPVLIQEELLVEDCRKADNGPHEYV